MLKDESLLKAWPNYRKFFRFPMLKEGKTAQREMRCGNFSLNTDTATGTSRSMRPTGITISVCAQRLAAEPGFDVARYREPYLNHLWDRAKYYNDLSLKVLGRSVPHTILVHYNLINALFLGMRSRCFESAAGI